MTVTVNGSNGITFNDGSSQTAAASPFGLKNRIINGDMRIDQRNAGASVASSATTYTLDRWRHDTTGNASFTYQRNAGSVTPPTGFTNYLGCTSTAAYTPASGTTHVMRQYIEGFNTADLAWGTANAQTVTVSFWVRSSLTGNFSFSLHNGTPTRSYVTTYTISAANTWEYKTITIAGDTTGTWATDNTSGMIVSFNLGTGTGTYGTSTTGWQAGQVMSLNGTVQVSATNGATWYLTGVQLEVGSTATPFERRMYTNELQLCQRYYVKYAFPVDTGAGASPLGTAVSPTLADGYIIPCVPFRVSATNLSLTVSSLQIYTVSSSGVFSTGTWAIPYDTNSLFVPIRYTHGSSVFTSGASQLIVGNGTTGFLALSAEF